MKKILSILFIVFLTNTQAQFWKDDIKGNGTVVTKERSIGDFNQIAITGSFKVEIVNGNTGKLQLTTDENLFNAIDTYVKNNRLYIRVKKDYNLIKYSELSIVLPVEKLKKISITGSATLFSKEKFNWNIIKLNIFGSGNIDLYIISNQIKASVTGSGDINLQGKTNHLSCAVTGSGNIAAREVISENAEAKVTGSGNVSIKAPVNDLKANVFGTGSIDYYGTPIHIKSKIFGSGNINLK